jgi:MurNAc alpha-1-phosphate uridylyltransferase
MMIPIAIIAGGLGTRLGQKTAKIPKSMIELNGKPFIFHQLRLLKSKGISDVVLCIGHLGEQIENYVGDGREWGLRVQYSYDGSVLLGTGGAIRQAFPKLPDSFFVIYGDSYLDIDFMPVLEKFRQEGKPALITVYKKQGEAHGTNTLFRDGKVIRYCKKNPTPDMEYIDYGLSVLTKRAFDGWPDGPLDLSDMYDKLSEEGELAGFEVMTRFYEVGSLQGILDTEEYLRAKGSRRHH